MVAACIAFVSNPDGNARIWLGVASTSTYTTFLIGRAFLGIFEAPIKSVVPSTITAIFSPRKSRS